MRSQLARDFERFRGELPARLGDYVRDAYRIDLATAYLGVELPHPVGKGSGQLSLNAQQLEADAEAGLAFVVLKTVIAEDAAGARSMDAWAVHETRMKVEPCRGADGTEGWTVTWRGRGWDRTLDDYLALVRAGRSITLAGGPLIVPSVKYHLPPADEPFRTEEYAHTTRQLAAAWGDRPLLLEQDFSPTLAGDPRAGAREAVLRWLTDVPRLIRDASPAGVTLALKLMNAAFDDAFQVEMVRAASAGGADALVVFNRLWDAESEVARGGPDLSRRNLRVLDLVRTAGIDHPPLCGTGDIACGRAVLDYARRGCAAVQVHTGFQLPRSEYPGEHASRSAALLHRIVFDPADGLIAALLDLHEQGGLEPRGGELRFRDVVGT